MEGLQKQFFNFAKFLCSFNYVYSRFTIFDKGEIIWYEKDWFSYCPFTFLVYQKTRCLTFILGVLKIYWLGEVEQDTVFSLGVEKSEGKRQISNCHCETKGWRSKCLEANGTLFCRGICWRCLVKSLTSARPLLDRNHTGCVSLLRDLYAIIM